jgi:hypothetical protein
LRRERRAGERVKNLNVGRRRHAVAAALGGRPRLVCVRAGEAKFKKCKVLRKNKSSCEKIIIASNSEVKTDEKNKLGIMPF